MGIGTPHAYAVAQDAVEEDEGIDACEDCQCRDEEDRRVVAGQRTQCLVGPIEGVEEDGKERVAQHVVIDARAGDEDVAVVVEAREVHVVVEYTPESQLSSFEKGSGIIGPQQCVKPQ